MEIREGIRGVRSCKRNDIWKIGKIDDESEAGNKKPEEKSFVHGWTCNWNEISWWQDLGLLTATFWLESNRWWIGLKHERSFPEILCLSRVWNRKSSLQQEKNIKFRTILQLVIQFSASILWSFVWILWKERLKLHW